MDPGSAAGGVPAGPDAQVADGRSATVRCGARAPAGLEKTGAAAVTDSGTVPVFCTVRGAIETTERPGNSLAEVMAMGASVIPLMVSPVEPDVRVGAFTVVLSLQSA